MEIKTYNNGAAVDTIKLDLGIPESLFDDLSVAVNHRTHKVYNVFEFTLKQDATDWLATDTFYIEFPTFDTDNPIGTPRQLFADDLGLGLATGAEAPCRLSAEFTGSPKCVLMHGSYADRRPTIIKITGHGNFSADNGTVAIVAKNPDLAGGGGDQTAPSFRVTVVNTSGVVREEGYIRHAFIIDSTDAAAVGAVEVDPTANLGGDAFKFDSGGIIPEDHWGVYELDLGVGVSGSTPLYTFTSSIAFGSWSNSVASYHSLTTTTGLLLIRCTGGDCAAAGGTTDAGGVYGPHRVVQVTEKIITTAITAIKPAATASDGVAYYLADEATINDNANLPAANSITVTGPTAAGQLDATWATTTV